MLSSSTPSIRRRSLALAVVGSSDSAPWSACRGRPRRPPTTPPGPAGRCSTTRTSRNAINPGNAPWVRENYAEPFDTIMDDNGQWYRNDYGPAWTTAFNSFRTYRKEFPVGQNGWLTASLSARDWNADGVIESPPSITTRGAGRRSAWPKINVPDHTGGAIFRPTQPAARPVPHRVQAQDDRLRRQAQRLDQLRRQGQRLLHRRDARPSTRGARAPTARAGAATPSAPYCEWQDVRSGPYGYNGFHFMSIVDFANPAPRNNHFWHYRRKVLMDSFSQHPDRVGTGTGGRICNSNTNTVLQLPRRQLQHRQHVDQRHAQLERRVAAAWPATRSGS